MSSALIFDGTDDKVTVSDSQALNFGASDSFAVSAWLKTNSKTEQQHIINKKSGGAGWRMFLDTQGRANFEVSDGEDTKAAIGASDLADDAWHLVEANVDRQGSVLRLFVDGDLAASEPIATVGDLSNAADLVIGVDDTGTNYYTGAAAEVRISSVARHSTAYTPGIQQYSDDADTVLLLHFNEGSGNKAYDMSLQRNDGALSGSPTWSDGPVPASPVTIVREYIWRALDVDANLSAYCASLNVKKFRIRPGDRVPPEDLPVDLLPALMVLPGKMGGTSLETVRYHTLALPIRISGGLLSSRPYDIEFLWHLVLSALFNSWKIEGGVLGCVQINSFAAKGPDFQVARHGTRNVFVTSFEELIEVEFRHRYLP